MLAAFHKTYSLRADMASGRMGTNEGVMMDWASEIDSAMRRIRGHVRETPTMKLALPGLPDDVEVKLEHMQHTGSFKARGAFNTLLAAPVPQGGVVAASGGNHGAAVAYAAHQLGIPAHIFVPEIAGPAKIDLIRRTGAQLHVVPGVYSDALAAARAHEVQSGAMQVHAYDAPETVAGQGTVFSEWEEQGLDADTVVIAVGGGGLIAGAAGWIGRRRKIIAVEPRQASALHAALNAGRPVPVEVGGVAANALGAREIGTICLTLAQRDEITSVLVEDADILAAQKLLWQEARIMVEPAGAAALAAVISGAYRPDPGEKLALLICGANPAPDPFANAV